MSKFNFMQICISLNSKFLKWYNYVTLISISSRNEENEISIIIFNLEFWLKV